MGKKNVVVILTDQHRSHALAARGFQFDYMASNFPICMLARSALLSGQYTQRCTGNLNTHHLLDKWHINPEPRLVGFDSWCYPLAYHRYYQQAFFEDDTAYVVDESAPFFEADKVEAFLNGYEREEPFFLFCNISLPHMPVRQIPEEYEHLYDLDQVELRKNVRSGGEE
jgi:hypothetical protein